MGSREDYPSGLSTVNALFKVGDSHVNLWIHMGIRDVASRNSIISGRRRRPQRIPDINTTADFERKWTLLGAESYPTVICDLEALVGLGPLGPIQKLISGGYDNTMKVWKLYNGMGKIDCPSCRVQVRSSCMILSRMKNIGHAVLIKSRLKTGYEFDQLLVLDVEEIVMDDPRVVPSEAFFIGQSVRSNILDVNSETEITEIKPFELKLKLGIGFHGRVHITEVCDENVIENPFGNLRIGQTVFGRIVAKANKSENNGKNHQWEQNSGFPLDNGDMNCLDDASGLAVIFVMSVVIPPNISAFYFSASLIEFLEGAWIPKALQSTHVGMDDKSNNREMVNSGLEIPNADAAHANAFHASVDVDMSGASAEDQTEQIGPFF
uniref:S1 motif domain-containing protein n=1 Tax=Vitis vinifera TaxID=29760 RepID=A5BZW5_VITVI|nr:hypothetical protein VITISV_019942 [Vitis vinifera]